MLYTLQLSEEQRRAVYEALGQYVENGENADDEEPGSVPLLGAASEILSRMDAEIAALAEAA